MNNQLLENQPRQQANDMGMRQANELINQLLENQQRQQANGRVIDPYENARPMR